MQILPFALFALSATVTPGPNNMLVTAAAARAGLRRTVPMIAGISLGLAAMMAAVGVGVGGVLHAMPGLDAVLRWVAFAWLIYLAWKIASAPPPSPTIDPRPPLGFWAMAGFQWINPKAWLMVLGTTSAWIEPGEAVAPQLALICAIFALMTLPCVGAWAVLGAAAGRVLGSPWRLRAFNVAMAVVLVGSMLPVVLRH